ncbi:QRFP-like peptide receptor [Montipora capricornis]|uniref:QRFP-like peptide receptor n=1 Tax=Montipora capricornis TaxID=246305 RepID=UPI0035F1E1EE
MKENNITAKAVEEQLYSSCNVSNSTTTEIARVITCIFIFLSSLFGNFLVILVIYRNRQMRTIVNLIIANMALSDCLCTLFVIPKDVTQTFTYPDAWLVTGAVGEALCKIVYFFQDVTVAVSLLSMLMIAIERYYAISRLFIADYRQYKRATIIISLSWFLAFLIYSTHFYTYKLLVEEEGTICTYSWHPLVLDASHDDAWKIDFLFHSILFIFVPFVIITILHAIILIKIRRIPIAELGSDTFKQRRERRYRKVLRILFAVVIAFGVCWFPYIGYVYVNAYVWSNKETEPPCSVLFFGQWALYLAYFNSSVNPAIYFAFSANYQYGAASLFRACRPSFSAKRGKQAVKQIELLHLRRTPRGK